MRQSFHFLVWMGWKFKVNV